VRFQAQTFWLAKDADEPDQYQDAFELDADRGIAAIADGVSSAIFSGPWARILTRAVVDEPPSLEDSEAFQAWLAEQRQRWSAQIDSSRLTWYQRPKMVDGAMTTLLWIEMTPIEIGENGLAKNYRLRCFAIGDSCMFHVRNGETLAMFPSMQPEAFGLNPAVVASVDRKVDHLLEFHAWETTCLPDDLLVLCTDAIALWACQQSQAGQDVDWRSYCEQSDEGWQQEIFALRDSGEMRFDDSTLLLLRIIEETPAPIELPSETPEAVEEEHNEALAYVEEDEAVDVHPEPDALPDTPAEANREDTVEPIDLAEAVEEPRALIVDSPPTEPGENIEPPPSESEREV
jgi:hypothetical protein